MTLKKTYCLILILALISVELLSQQSAPPALLKDSIFKIRLPNVINSYQPAIVPVLSLDGNILYFDRPEHPKNIGGIRDKDDIWYSIRNSDGSWSDPQNIGTPINTDSSDALFTITPDGRYALLYGIYTNDERQKQSGFSIAEIDGRIIKKPKALNITNYYNRSRNFYASLSYDRKVLLMALNREDSQGDLDLYISFRDDKTNTWSEPRNLGIPINTSGAEGSPFLAYDMRTLFFTSENHNSLGERDLFVTRRVGDSWNIWTEPMNLGKPINSVFDENGIWLTPLGDSAYIVSNDSITLRKGLYLVKIPSELRPNPYVILTGSIYALNSETPKLLSGTARFIVTYSNFDKIDTFYSCTNSTYSIVLPDNAISKLRVEAQGCEAFEFEIETDILDKSRYLTRDIVLKKKVDGKQLITTIYFDYNKDTNKEEFKLKLVDLLNIKDRRGKLLFVGHTDEVGTADYNQKLSQKRAVNAARYAEKLGIDNGNVVIEAKGKTQPVSVEPALNRRVEIYFVPENE